MAITVTHQFVSLKGDGTDATLVRPTNWNASHNINMATNRVIGRLTAGPGAAEELPVTSYMMALLNTADYAALAVLLGLPTTGDAKLTYKSTADVGWILANDGTIGDAGSGATRANLDTQALFTFFYNNFVDAVCPVQTSAGGATTRVAQGTAANAFSTAKCRMVIPKTLGRALIVGGSGAGLTSRTLGASDGFESTVLTTAMIPKHTHTWGSSLSATSVSGTASGSTSTTINANTGANDTDHVHNLTATIASRRSFASGYNLDHSHTYSVSVGYSTKAASAGTSCPTGENTVSTGTSSLGAMDHLHYVDINNNTGGQLGGTYGNGTHRHNLSGTFAGTCSVNTWTGVTVSGTVGGTTDVMSVGDGAHTNMQPWTAWNIMIRL